ncbi:MAG: DUF3293 domain-containing protein [Actinomycetota bacterium]|nr:DUF3293 domain-containing protein [Actinomycetota bacterium]
MAEEVAATTGALMALWTRVRVEVVISEKVLVVFDPDQGYRDLAAAFEMGGAPVDELLWVITAWNPGALEREARVNRLSQARMLLQLARAGVGFFPSKGSAEGWEEPGTAFFSPTEERVAALAKRFGQLGYYRFSRTEGFCVDAGGHFPPARLLGSGKEVSTT